MSLSGRAFLLAVLQPVVACLIICAGAPDPVFLGMAGALGVTGILTVIVYVQLRSGSRARGGHLISTLAAVALGVPAFIGPVLELVESKGMGVEPVVWLILGLSLLGFGLAAWLHHDLPR